MNNKNQIVKHERFKNVAARRVQKVLDNLENLSKCSNKANYDYTDAEISKMLKAIKEAVKNLESCFAEKSNNKSKRFEF
jgi:hypothetical protein